MVRCTKIRAADSAGITSTLETRKAKLATPAESDAVVKPEAVGRTKKTWTAEQIAAQQDAADVLLSWIDTCVSRSDLGLRVGDHSSLG